MWRLEMGLVGKFGQPQQAAFNSVFGGEQAAFLRGRDFMKLELGEKPQP